MDADGRYVSPFCNLNQYWFNACIKAFTILFSYINFLPIPWRWEAPHGTPPPHPHGTPPPHPRGTHPMAVGPPAPHASLHVHPSCHHTHALTVVRSRVALLQYLVLSARCGRLGMNAHTVPPPPPWRAATEPLSLIRSDLRCVCVCACVCAYLRVCVCTCAVFCSNRSSDAGVDFYGRPTDVLWFNIERRVRKRIAIGLNLAWICHFTSLTTHLVWPEYIQGQTWPAGKRPPSLRISRPPISRLLRPHSSRVSRPHSTRVSHLPPPRGPSTDSSSYAPLYLRMPSACVDDVPALCHRAADARIGLGSRDASSHVKQSSTKTCRLSSRSSSR
jgi:hypothetical protein